MLSVDQQPAATLLTPLPGQCGARAGLRYTAAGAQWFSESDANLVQLEQQGQAAVSYYNSQYLGPNPASASVCYMNSRRVT